MVAKREEQLARAVRAGVVVEVEQLASHEASLQRRLASRPYFVLEDEVTLTRAGVRIDLEPQRLVLGAESSELGF